MNLAQCIIYLYPSAIPLTDFLANLHNGVWTITKWNDVKLGPQPTQAELKAAWPAVQLQTAQTQQRATIKQSFTNAANAPVTDSSGITWEGGESSGNSIFLGCQLAQQSGATTITLYDAAKAPHSMTIAEGMAVAALIGAAYQTALGKKNTLYANINAAKTVKAVQGVVW